MKNYLLKRMALAAVMIVVGTVGIYANNGDVFTVKTIEGVQMTFTVINDSEKTCFVGESNYASNSNSCIDKSVTGTVTIPETAMGYTVKYVCEYAFQQCSIEEVVVPKSVSVDHYGVFWGCKNLKKFWFHNGINRVPWGFFNYCEALEDVYLPSSVKTIDSNAFRGCKNLHTLQLPESLQTVSSGAFSNMSHCDFIFLNPTPPTFGDDCFNGMEIDDWGYGEFFCSNFYCWGEDAQAAYLSALEAQSYLSSIELYVDSYIPFINDRETTGYMIWGVPVIKEGKLNYVSFEEIPPADVTELKIPATVKGLSVASISNLFGYAGSTTIKKVVLPETLKFIYLESFRNFSALEDINLPEGLETIYSWSFAGCSSLKEITFPSTLKGLERGAFRNCDNLKNVYMNARNVDLFSGEYAGNSACEHATMHVPFGTLKNFDTDAWHNEFMWREQMDAKDGDIFPSPFKTDQDMWFQVISANDKTCRVYGDDDQKAVDQNYEGSVNIPQKPEGFTVTEIGDYAFYYCLKLTVVNIPNTVKRIGEGAFTVCTNLVSATIPASVEVIGDFAFSWDVNLSSLNLNEGLKEIGSGAFGICTELYSVTLPSTLKKLGDTAFAFCSNLTDINIPSGINIIDRNTFLGCISLASIDLPASVAYLGSSCFQNCNKLSQVNLGNSHVVLLDSDGNETDDNNAFASSEYRYSELHIPEGTLDYYNTTPWTTWFNAILSTLPNIATSIDGTPVQAAGQDKWFTVDGQQIEQPAQPGLFIRNGKKVVVK